MLYISHSQNRINRSVKVRSETPVYWASPDIWLEDIWGNELTEVSPNTDCYLCVRIHNKGYKASSGGERLFLNWAKANTTSWSEEWFGKTGRPYMLSTGGIIGDSIGYQIPLISFIRKIRQ